MHTSRFRSVLVMIGLFLGGFTACHKVHPSTQANEDENTASDTKPLALALNRPAALVAAEANEKADVADLTPLHWEVAALEAIHQLQLTRTQLQYLAKLAPSTAAKAPPSQPTKVSDEYQKTLKELRDALVEDDEDRITDFSVALDELSDKENPDFEDVEISDAARRQTPEVLRRLSARQVIGYLAEFADEFPDPREKLTDAYDDARKETGKEWEGLRDEVAGQVAWLVAGLDKTAEGRVRERAKDLLTRVHMMKDDEYTAQKAVLERAAQVIVGNAGPTEVIRHFTERSLAELLSNPRLAVAAEAILKKAE